MQPPEIIPTQSTIYAAKKGISVLDSTDGKMQQKHLDYENYHISTYKSIIYANKAYGHIIQAIRAQDGRLIWTYKVEGRLCFSPTVVNNSVYVCTDEGFVYAFHANNGALLWHYKAPSLLLFPPIVIEHFVYISLVASSSSQIVVTASSTTKPLSQPSICVLQTSDGMLLQQFQIPASTTFPLIIKNKNIYISTQNECIALDGNSGMLLWRRKLEGQCRSEPIFMDDKVCISSSVFRRVRSPTQPGHIIQWQDTFLSVLHTSDGSLCWQQPLRTGSGESNPAASTSSDKDRSKPSTPLGGDPTVPCIMDTIIYVGVGGTLLAFRLDDGMPLWHYYTEGTFLSTPKILNGVVYIGANDGSVYALQGDNGVLLWRTQIEIN